MFAEQSAPKSATHSMPTLAIERLFKIAQYRNVFIARGLAHPSQKSRRMGQPLCGRVGGRLGQPPVEERPFRACPEPAEGAA